MERDRVMQAWVRERYGSPDVLELREVERPELADDAVLVRVRAVSVNPADWYAVHGTPFLARLGGGLRRPKTPLVGTDFSGVVEAVGKDFDGLEPGDEVFGGRTGAFAEYVCVKNAVVRKPANVSFEEAAGVPVAAVTALQGLRDHGGLRPGQKVLVNGASGGVGTYAVQIAKALGADVTAVCSTPNVETARALGADRVVDYTKEDFTESGERYDVFFDVAGSRSWRECKRVLAPEATFVVAGVGSVKRGVIGPLRRIVSIRAAALGSRQRRVFFLAKLTREDMEVLRGLLESGQLRTVLDRGFGFDELPQALRRLGEGHARGKIVVSRPANEPTDAAAARAAASPLRAPSAETAA
jgi:NADPH:quinone reductase-like Zn-dependent oxidoreductase